MLSKSFKEFYAKLKFSDEKLKVAFDYVLNILQNVPTKIDSQQLDYILNYLMMKINPISTHHAKSLCTSMDALIQLMPYDVFIQSYIAQQRRIAENNGLIQVDQAGATEADKRIKKTISELEQVLSQNEAMDYRIMLPKSTIEGFQRLMTYYNDVNEMYQLVLQGYESLETASNILKQELAQALLETKKLKNENARLEKELQILQRLSN